MNERDYWIDRHKRLPPMRAVGHRSRTVEVNAAQYARARLQLVAMLRGDDATSVLDVGCGFGYHAQTCGFAGVTRYHGFDFATSPTSPTPIGYTFEFGVDATEPFDVPGGPVDVAMLLDVAYHVTDDGRFAALLSNVVAAVRPCGLVYVTGTFVSAPSQDHCRHRPLAAHAALGEHLSTADWRDNKIARFRTPAHG